MSNKSNICNREVKKLSFYDKYEHDIELFQLVFSFVIVILVYVCKLIPILCI